MTGNWSKNIKEIEERYLLIWDKTGEKYKPFKGVKYVTTVKNGRFQIRT